MGSKNNLDPLPENTSEFWEGAEVHGNIIPERVYTEQGDLFIRLWK